MSFRGGASGRVAEKNECCNVGVRVWVAFVFALDWEVSICESLKDNVEDFERI